MIKIYSSRNKDKHLKNFKSKVKKKMSCTNVKKTNAFHATKPLCVARIRLVRQILGLTSRKKSKRIKYLSNIVNCQQANHVNWSAVQGPKPKSSAKAKLFYAIQSAKAKCVKLTTKKIKKK